MRSTTVLLIASTIALASAKCCPRKSAVSCCGTGPCNIFCCNCKHGCNLKQSSSCLNNRDVTPLPPLFVRAYEEDLSDEQMHAEAAKNGANHFTYEEFLAYQGLNDQPEIKEHFDGFDRNGDGVITVDEIRK